MDRKKAFFLVLGLILIGSAVLFFNGGYRNSSQGDDDNVVEGGLLGGPVNIGGGRVSVTSEAENVTVNITSEKVTPLNVTVPKNSVVRIVNQDSERHEVVFEGLRKSAVLKPGYVYELRASAQGSYVFLVSTGSGSVEGRIVVR